MGVSPLHASTVGLILNPNTNRISPQFHCVYDDYFETVFYKDENQPPPNWDDLIINSRYRNSLEDDDSDLADNWEQPIATTNSNNNNKTSADNNGSMDPYQGNPVPTARSMDPLLEATQENPVPATLRPTADKLRPPEGSPPPSWLHCN